MTAIDYVDKQLDLISWTLFHLLHYQITHPFLFLLLASGLKFGCLNLTMDVGMDENWATIAIEHLDLPILGVLGNFLLYFRYLDRFNLEACDRPTDRPFPIPQNGSHRS